MSPTEDAPRMLRYAVADEFRPVKAGEWYCHNRYPEGFLAKADIEEPHWVLKLVMHKIAEPNSTIDLAQRIGKRFKPFFEGERRPMRKLTRSTSL